MAPLFPGTLWQHFDDVDLRHQLSLVESYCLPILIYASSVIMPMVSYWNLVYCKIFGFICGLGKLNLKHVFMLHKCRWICKVRRYKNRIVHDLFWSEMFHVKDDTCMSYFKSSVAVTRCIHDMWSCWVYSAAGKTFLEAICFTSSSSFLGNRPLRVTRPPIAAR